MPEILRKATTGYAVKQTSTRPGGTLECCISSDSCDRDNDIVICKGGQWDNFLKTNPCLLWSHSFQQIPLGRVNKIWLSADGHRVLAQVEFADHDFALEVEKLYRSRALNAFSVGFRVIDAGPPGREIYSTARPDLAGKAIRVIRSWELLEVSAVCIGANVDAVQEALETKGFLKHPQIRESLRVYGSVATRKAAVATPRPVETAEGQEVSCSKCGKIKSTSVCRCQDSDTAAAVAAKLVNPEFVGRIVADVVGKVQGRIVARQLADQLVANVVNGVEDHIAERKLDQVLYALGVNTGRRWRRRWPSPLNRRYPANAVPHLR